MHIYVVYICNPVVLGLVDLDLDLDLDDDFVNQENTYL